MNTLYEKLIDYYNGIPDYRKGQIEYIKSKLDQVDDNEQKHFFNLVRTTCDRFPSEKQLWEILKQHPECYRKDRPNYNLKAKQTGWRGITLFPHNYENGQECIICGSPIENQNCTIVEKADDGYDKVIPCPCCGSDPEFQFIDEWKAYCRTNGLCSYQMFYLHKINREK